MRLGIVVFGLHHYGDLDLEVPGLVIIKFVEIGVRDADRGRFGMDNEIAYYHDNANDDHD